MTFVEHIYPGFQWAESMRPDGKLDLEELHEGAVLRITGFLPRYATEGDPADAILDFNKASKRRRVSAQKNEREGPDIAFANADTDEKLKAFVRRFGPIVARSVSIRPENDSGRPILRADQEMDELRNEQCIYRASWRLLMLQREPDLGKAAIPEIQEIADRISAWPRQRVEQRKSAPNWNLRPTSLKRIKHIATANQGFPASPALDARIVICELLNAFPGTVFPNGLELNSSIRHGIRPLLYSLLRRQFPGGRDVAACANTQCGDFFDVGRSGQKFCSPTCSRQQRQRDYWDRRGRRLRGKRLRKLKH